MRMIFLTLTLFFFSYQCLASDKKIPNYNLPALTSGNFESSELKGHTTIVEFWASWCESCGKTMGKLHQLLKNKDVQFKTISVDEDIEISKRYFNFQPPEIKPLIKRAFFDKEGQIAEKLGVEAIPTILVIDSHQKIILKIQGYPKKADFEKLKKLVK